MTVVDVVWLNQNPDAIARGYWDQGILEAIFDGSVWQPDTDVSYTHHESTDGLDGAVVVVPGRHNDPKNIDSAIANLEWVLLIITGDEECTFDPTQIKHPNCYVWYMTPNPRIARTGVFPIPSGWPPGIQDTEWMEPRSLGWFFAGQDNHVRRSQCISELARREDGDLLATEGFTQGMPQDKYWESMAKAKIAPCPGGPVSPDSFRVCEALELGAVPLADASSAAERDPGYWIRIFGQVPPFPIVEDWAHVDEIMEDILSNWPADGAVCSSFWQQYLRELAWKMQTDVALLAEADLTRNSITVLIPTSPLLSHPSTEIITETIRSVRERLPFSEILIMCDGVHSEQEHLRTKYEAYLYRLTQQCRHMNNVVPIIFNEHLHQGVMTKYTLHKVRSAFVLFVEHDTPLVGDIDFNRCMGAIFDGPAELIRFYHETAIPEEHKYLMLSDRMDINGVPLIPTVQWSQRPHLASRKLYDFITSTYFGSESRTMIEDVMYSVLETHWKEEGYNGWKKFGTYIYAPEGDMKRSTHLDGRGGADKLPMMYAYDSEETPLWAPDPGIRKD